jgi:hypothetical protein
MQKLEILIKEFITIVTKRFRSECDLNLENIYFYYGFEILPFMREFYKIDGVITEIKKGMFPRWTQERSKEIRDPYMRKYEKLILDYCSYSQKPPTHIKATYTVATDHLDIEYIYDQLLDEDAGDDFGKIYDEWQYELGMPRPTPIHIPDGHHLEFHSIKKEVLDDQGRVIRIDSELSPVIVKD